MPSCPGRSSSLVLSTALVPGTLGFRESSISFGPRRSSRTFCGGPTLVICWRASPWCPHNLTFCWGPNLLDRFVSGSLVGSGAEPLGQTARAPGHPPRPSLLRSLSRGPHSRDLYGQHYSSVLRPQTGQDVLSCPEPRSPTPPTLGGDHESRTSAPVHDEDMKHGCGLSEPLGPGHRLRMNLSSGCSGRVVEAVAGGHRSVCHLPQLSTSGIFLPLEQPDGGGDRYLPSIVGRAPGVHLSTFCPASPCAQQAEVQQRHPPHLGGSTVAPGVVSGAPELGVGSSCVVALPHAGSINIVGPAIAAGVRRRPISSLRLMSLRLHISCRF